MDLLPKVFRTEGDVVDFEPIKIFNSIIKETNMNEEEAKEITELTVRRIISSGMKFLSGPHIREIVCSILSENHYEQERKLYTRIGMPLMDYEEILEKGISNHFGISLNPEKIHHWAANQLAEEYTLLRILSDSESKAHLFGDLYIHQLKYFDLRPYNQYYDPRLILKYGLPPVEISNKTCHTEPAMDLKEAVDHLTNWIGMIQTEFSGNQGLDFISTFLAPYCSSLDKESIKSILKSFIYKLNYLSSASGKNNLKISISYSPEIPLEFLDLPAIGPRGTFVGTYSSYKKESRNIFECFSEIFTEGDACGKNFHSPNQMVYIDLDSLKSSNNELNLLINQAFLTQNPNLINLDKNFRQKFKKEFYKESFGNHGVMQKISVNLPRYAFISKEEDKFEEILLEKMKICFGILKKKYDIILQRLETKHLPLCSGLINGKQIYELKNQELCVGVVGLNEAVKVLSGFELHEENSAFRLGKKIMNSILNLCTETGKDESKNFSLIDSSSKRAIERFLRLDLKHYPKLSIKNYQKSTQFSPKADIDLRQTLLLQGIFHKIVQNEPKIEIFKQKNHINDVGYLKEILLHSFEKTDINQIRFI